MILADTSAWIEYFSGRQSDIKERIEALIKDNNQICICGIVIQEILQGIKDDKTYKYLRDRLLAFPYIDTDLDTYLIASFIYRKLRRKGFSAPTIDLLISALCVRENIPLLTIDKHFKEIAKVSNLKLA